MSNIAVTVRIAPCVSLLSGNNSDDCRPADDIVDPVAINSVARAQEVGQQVLYADGHRWVSRQITTGIEKAYRWGDTFIIDTKDGRKVGIVGPVQQNFSDGSQSFAVKYIAE